MGVLPLVGLVAAAAAATTTTAEEARVEAWLHALEAFFHEGGWLA